MYDMFHKLDIDSQSIHNIDMIAARVYVGSMCKPLQII